MSGYTDIKSDGGMDPRNRLDEASYWRRRYESLLEDVARASVFANKPPLMLCDKESYELGRKNGAEEWRNAAIRVGEELASVGPDGYYDMTPAAWLEWAMQQQPRGKTSLVSNHAWTPSDWTDYERDIAAAEREVCAKAASVALLGADKALADRVLKAIRARGRQ